MKKERRFATEADLCAAFIAHVAASDPAIKVYAEWAGWDILLAYPEGFQLGIQAKLRLNADVIGQAAPDVWYGGDRGPDFRAVLVPERGPWAHVVELLGLLVFACSKWDAGFGAVRPERGFQHPSGSRNDWFDWNPERRHALPETPTDAVAGSSAPVTLTPWKILALSVLAELERDGKITAKRMRTLGVDPRRWQQFEWLVPGEQRGDWTRGEKCPPFDKQHPTAYGAAIEKARARPDA